MKIAFGGDVFLGGELLSHGAAPLDVPSFRNADLRVVNLEQSASDLRPPASKSTLYTSSDALDSLHTLNVQVVSQANNHAHDQGPDGLTDTLTALDNRGIGHVGAGATASEARAPLWLESGVALLAYSDFGRPYLKNVLTAGIASPGTAPLRDEIIRDDLDALPEASKCVLMFHWGQEHLWLPPMDDVKLAKKLLEHPRVLAIIGGHAHRAQGIVNHAGKHAYMCLGNFLFPNFYIVPPSQIANDAPPGVRWSTKRYHRVHEPTFKSWTRVNRTSLVVTLDTDTGRLQHSVAVQQQHRPRVEIASGFGRWWVNLRTHMLSRIYGLPPSIYNPLQKFESLTRKNLWRASIYIFDWRQLGTREFIRFALGKKMSR